MAVPKLKAMRERSTFTGVPGVTPSNRTVAGPWRKLAIYVFAAAKALASVFKLENVAAPPLTVLTARLFTVNGRAVAPLLA